MSQTNLADPDVVVESDQEVIDVPDDSASQSAGNKRALGRPASDAWNNFKRIPNPNPGNSKYLGVCKDCGQKVTAKPEDLRRHASHCTKSSKETRLASHFWCSSSLITLLLCLSDWYCHILAGLTSISCSTTEMLEVFSEFYDGDKQDMHGQNVDNTRIDSSVPFSAKEFDLDFTGSAEQVELFNMDFGVSTDAYDLNELLE